MRLCKIIIIFQVKSPLGTVQDLLRVAGTEKRQYTFFQDPSDGLNFSLITLLKGKRSSSLLHKQLCIKFRKEVYIAIMTLYNILETVMSLWSHLKQRPTLLKFAGQEILQDTSIMKERCVILLMKIGKSSTHSKIYVPTRQERSNLPVI